MKSVLISIQPQWCELIAAGKKILEIRKTRPKLETPFKCYIYQTKKRWSYKLLELLKSFAWAETLKTGRGKVIGEFICDTFVTDITFGHDPMFNAAACMSEIQAASYITDSPAFGWHISDLKIYDKPKKLSEFYAWKKCNSCKKSSYEASACAYGERCMVPARITRPPQSWCYVEEV